MGIFDAMNTSVGGLQAQSYALQNISGNIANSSTTGYKGIGTSFVDLIPDSSVPSKQVAGGVTASAKATITTQGTISSSSVATNMAITGDGFFSVQKASGVVDNVPVFNGVTYYSRRGDFQVLRGDAEVARLHPEKRVYDVQRNMMTEAAIDAGLFRDLYIALGEPLDAGPAGQAWAVRLYYKPFVRWLWLGALFMAAGGVVAASDRRYRLRKAAVVPAGATETVS